ncbi:unnamed protein product [Closterium sp. Naga37s-1]|nr:unnamed protein product [Closterium sp. Naga37s-1]
MWIRVPSTSHHEGIRAAGAGRAGQCADARVGEVRSSPTPFLSPHLPPPPPLHAAMKAFELLGLGAQDTVQYTRAGGGGVALPHLSSFPLSPLPPTFPPSPPASLHAAMKAFALLGLGAQGTVQYARAGEVGGDGAGDNDHDLDPLDHDSHNHVASSTGGASLRTRESPPARKQQQQQQQQAERAAEGALDQEMAGGGRRGGGGGGRGGSGVGEVRRPRQAAAAPWCSVSEGVIGGERKGL